MQQSRQRIERIGDIGLLSYWIKKRDLAEKIDEIYPTHGNWTGPGLGKTLLVWLVYMLSEADHRQSKVEDWVEARLQVLRYLMDEPDLEAKHFNDDRLGLLLEYLSDDAKWEAFNTPYTQDLLQVYDLNKQASSVVRFDSVSAGSFREVEGLFRMGYSKQHRSDIPRLKLMLACLDPLAMPVASYVVEGSSADDPLYIPTIEKTWKVLPKTGLFYVGDSKMGSIENRAFIAKSGNFYVVPLNLVQYDEKSLNAAIQTATEQKDKIKNLYANAEDEKSKLVARMLELPVRIINSETGDFSWTERLVLVQAPDNALRQQKQLKAHLEQTFEEISTRFQPAKGRHSFKSLEEAESFVKRTLSEHQCSDLLQVHIHQQIQRTSCRAYKGQPPSVKEKLLFSVEIQRKEDLINQRLEQCGWAVYSTNNLSSDFDLSQITIFYRGQYRVEQKFHQLLNKTTSLTPIFLSLQHRIIALIRILILALQFASLMQHQIRTKLEKQNEKLKDVIPGNPGRLVAQPTIESLLKRFDNVSVAAFFEPQSQQLFAFNQGLKPIHLQVLELLDIPPEIYTNPAIYFKELILDS